MTFIALLIDGRFTIFDQQCNLGSGRMKRTGYKNLTRKAEGPFWTLYEGVDAANEQRVWLQTFDLPDPDLRRRLEAVLNYSRLLQHPNILSPFDVAEHNGRPVLLYRPFVGRSAHDLISSGVPIVERRATAALRQAAAALQYAAIRGIRHGVFSPFYLFLSNTGDEAKVMGFGFNRLAPSAGGVDLYDSDDRGALGLTAYQMLCGRLLTQDSRLPALREVNPKLSAPISELVESLIDPDPRRRATFGVVLDRLDPKPVEEPQAPSEKIDFKHLKETLSHVDFAKGLVGARKRVMLLGSLFVLGCMLLFVAVMLSLTAATGERRYGETYREFLDYSVQQETPPRSEELTPEERPKDEAISRPAQGGVQQRPTVAEVEVTFEKPSFADYIRINDAEPRQLPLRTTLIPGHYRLTFIDSLFAFHWPKSFLVEAGAPKTVRIEPSEVGSGELAVILQNADQFGYVHVTIDESQRNTTPFLTRLYAGRHRVRTYRENLNVSPTDTVVFIVPSSKATIQVKVLRQQGTEKE